MSTVQMFASIGFLWVLVALALTRKSYSMPEETWEQMETYIAWSWIAAAICFLVAVVAKFIH